MKESICRAAAGVLALSGAASAAHAEVTADLAFTSDYVWRGVSQSDEDPAIQGGFEYGHSTGFYAGVWGSNVDFDEEVADSADLEIDLYAGYGSDLGDTGLAWDVGVLRYMYPGTSADLDWTEVYLGLSYGVFSASVNYSNDVFGTDERGVYYTAGVDWPLDLGFTVSAGVGFYDFDEQVNGIGNPDSYLDYRLGVSAEYAGFGFSLTYYDTDSDGEALFGDWADSRVVLTVSRAL